MTIDILQKLMQPAIYENKTSDEMQISVFLIENNVLFLQSQIFTGVYKIHKNLQPTLFL